MCVEVLQRSLTEEDRVRESPVVVAQLRGLSVRVRDPDCEVAGLDRFELRLSQHGEAVAIHRLRRAECGGWLGVVGARDVHGLDQLEVPRRSHDIGVDVDEDAVRSRPWERHHVADLAIGRDRRMVVDDQRQIVADADQVNAGVRARPLAIARQRPARRLIDDE